MKSRDEQAIEYAKELNSGPSRDIKCPRDVADAGSYFGFIVGWNARDEEINALKEENKKLMNAIGWSLHQADPQNARNCIEKVWNEIRDQALNEMVEETEKLGIEFK